MRSCVFASFYFSVSETRNAGPAQPGSTVLGFTVVYLELEVGEGQRGETVGAGGGRGTAGVPLKEQLQRGLLCGCTAKWWLLVLIKR